MYRKHIFRITSICFAITIIILGGFIINNLQKNTQLTADKQNLQKQLTQKNNALVNLQQQDQYVINKNLEAQIKQIETIYPKSIHVYEQLLDLKTMSKDTSKFDATYADSIALLSKRNFASASSQLDQLSSDIQKEKDKISAAFTIPQNVPSSNAAPGSGFSSQQVTTDTGTFLIYIIAADLNSTRVIVDTASDSDCSNNCPVLPLADYVSRNGAFAGINGTFFCPADYPSCAGKTGSFDTLLMNKNKHYFNSDNNVYSLVPLVYFTGNTMGVRGQSSQWGRDTGVDSVIAMQPLLVSGGSIVYGGSGDAKYNSKGPRDFIGNKGSTVYIGTIFNADMNDSAHVLHTLGLDNALNLDEGGSTALWYGGYKAGPGRNIPNAVLFVRK